MFRINHTEQENKMESTNAVQQELLKKKGLDVTIFLNAGIKFDDPISAHAAFVFKCIYAFPYNQNNPTDKNLIAREVHGIQHTSRVALFIVIFASLWQKYAPNEARELDERGLKLAQLAALFHDAAREDDGTDHWDNDSGMLLYFYLTETLKVSKSEAVFFAEVIANKDMEKDKLILLVKNNTPTWDTEKDAVKKNIFTMLLHDADCLDIIRARRCFDKKYLDFFNTIAEKNQNALDELDEIIKEATDMIHNQGDRHKDRDIKEKAKYENSAAYDLILNDTKTYPKIGSRLLKKEKNDGYYSESFQTLFNIPKLLIPKKPMETAVLPKENTNC